MNNPRLIILRHLVTEKGTRIREHQNKYFFAVHMGANKIDVKRAVESLFKVHVEEVNTLIMRGKTRRYGFRRQVGVRPNWKKAVIRLKKGETIEAFENI